MKILYLTNLTAPYRMKFFNQLGKKCELTVLVERKGADNRDDKWLQSIKSSNFQLIELKSLKIGEESSLSFEVLKYLKREYDLIVVGGYSTITAMFSIVYMKLKKIPFVLNADGGFPNYNERKVNYLIKKFFISSAFAWVTTSNEAKEYFRYYGADNEKIFIYPFTSVLESQIQLVETEKKIEARNKLNVSANSKVFLTVGQIIYRKGLDVLLNAFAEVDIDYELYIVGGKETNELQQIIKERNVKNVHFIEFLSEEELAVYYKAADVFVFPTRFDVWGLVVNEAMSFGLPVISSDAAGAAKEMIENGYNGVMFESENISDLAEKVQQLVRNDEQLRQMSIRAYETAKEFSIEQMSEKHYKIFCDLLD